MLLVQKDGGESRIGTNRNIKEKNETQLLFLLQCLKKKIKQKATKTRQDALTGIRLGLLTSCAALPLTLLPLTGHFNIGLYVTDKFFKGFCCTCFSPPTLNDRADSAGQRGCGDRAAVCVFNLFTLASPAEAGCCAATLHGGHTLFCICHQSSLATSICSITFVFLFRERM